MILTIRIKSIHLHFVVLLQLVRMKNIAYYDKNEPAHNRQFGASGGVASCDTSRDFGSLPPVRALPIPPPDAKLLKRYRQPNWTGQQ